MWKWDSEKWTEVIAVLCINICKEKDHPEDLFVSNQKKWVSVSEERITQYGNQKSHGLCLLPQNSSLNIVNIFSFKIFAFTKYQVWEHSTDLHSSLQNIREFTNFVFIWESKNLDLELQGWPVNSQILEAKNISFFNFSICLDFLCSPRKKKGLSNRDTCFLVFTLKGIAHNQLIWREMYYLRWIKLVK